jgi:hypothetical protein
MAQNQPPEITKPEARPGSAPRKVGMYDRPTQTTRVPMNVLIAVIILLAVIASVAVFYFF